MRGRWRSLGCSCLYASEVNEASIKQIKSSIKQISLVFQFDLYSTPHRDVTVLVGMLLWCVAG